MKVGLFCYAFPYPKSGFNPGIETLTYNLAKSLSRKIDVSVYTSFINGGIEKEKIDGFRVLRARGLQTGLFSINLVTHAWNIKKKFDKEIKKEDVLHDIGSSMPFWFKYFKSPSVVTFHHFEPSHGIRNFFSKFPITSFTRREDKTDIITAVSESAKQDLLIKYNSNNVKVEVIPNGVNTEIFHPGESKKENMLFFAGPLTYRKGLRYLIESLPIIMDKIGSIEVIVAGKGPEMSKLIHLTNELGVNGQVKFLGFVSQEKLLKYYRSAAAFVFPTLKEGFGMVALEAMACGTPVVASNIEPLRSIIGDAGLFFEPENHEDLARKVIEILENEELRIRLSKRGVKHASEYPWDRIADQYLSLYRSLLEERGK